ncbi:MAG TPA: TetR/AcrR family transcriptional regulator [Candidatus Dormibacteraeota bacterium]|jgi:AcrR family transcriptional regulator|nr:TetR/AcrR family transcriptional regulator [Candidatus Dormibacteraeota bacterium]
MSNRRTDTRTQIQQVALDLFSEQGYEKTSLREISERLGVTKAALYYHFKTKEDILRSVFQDAVAEVDDLVAWGRARPRTRETRAELLRRYGTILDGRWRTIMVFQHENQGSLHDLVVAGEMQTRMWAVFDLFRDPDAPIVDQLRAVMAVMALHLSMGAGKFGFPGTPEEIKAAALEISADLIGIPRELVLSDPAPIPTPAGGEG